MPKDPKNGIDMPEFDDFSKEMLENYDEVLGMFKNNPDMFKNVLKPILEMQKDYIDNPEKLSSLMSNSGEETERLLKKIIVKLAKLEKRLEDSGVLKTDD